MTENIPTLAGGREIIQRYVAQLPLLPGVYRMIDAQGNVLYIGKAKQLKNRVSNYVNVGALNTRLQRMVSLTATMEFITTRSEAEALLLEANLIKKHMPRYNILLRDDKSFPYIFFSGDHPYPRLGKHRGAKTPKGKYYGPFVSGLAVNETITLLQKAFLLRPCSDNIFKNRSRPCLQYQIKRCSAPCVGLISEADYAALAKQAQDFLSGKSRQIQDELVKEMQQLSLNMHFEKASIIRDRIKALTQIQQDHHLNNHGLGDADVIAIARESGMCCVQLFSFRGGRNYGNKSWFPQHTMDSTDSEIISLFMAHYYQTQPVPALIYVSHVLEEVTVLEEALRLNVDYKVEIFTPIRGQKRDVIDEVARNAKEALMRHMTMQVSQRQALKEVAKLFGLDEAPERIEVYDNSHIMGTNAVGGMIVAGRDGFIKNAYRKFNIKNPSTVPGDDYGMMREVLTRRFKALQEGTEQAGRTPELVLIDGGAGHLKVVNEVFEELGVQGVVLAAISKGVDRNAGREWFHMIGREPFQLPENDPVLHYLQRIRDEAHRYAIGTHRAKRSKVLQSSPLDAITQIGPSRKKALLLHFGSAREVSAASLSDIEKVPGISTSMAKIIYEHFH